MEQPVTEQPSLPPVPPRLNRRPIGEHSRPLPPTPPQERDEDVVQRVRRLTICQRANRLVASCCGIFCQQHQAASRDYHAVPESEFAMRVFRIHSSTLKSCDSCEDSLNYSPPCVDAQIHIARCVSQIRRMPWYFGHLNRLESEEILTGQRRGAFLVYNSLETNDSLSFYLSFQFGDWCIGYPIVKKYDRFGFELPLGYYRSRTNLVDLIKFLIEDSSSENFAGSVSVLLPLGHPAGPLNLVPLSRHSAISSLKHLCRFEITTRIHGNGQKLNDAVSSLRLPNSLRDYLLGKLH